ncbi:hypothetical protein JTB14_021790 [Gonioctena quinquepunctata]|nr:hypothetical protein JTB14_021790 [Gonioctena quinquepunctata]
MSMDSKHHEEKDGDETFQGNEDTLDEETEPIEERRYNLRDHDFSDNTDCDSGGEESNSPDHLNHNQLSAEAENFFEDNDRISESEHLDGYEWKEYRGDW